jgi:redox-sensitive bicupin YhaK (pirin superfamily)
MATQVDTTERQVVLVEDAQIRPMGEASFGANRRQGSRSQIAVLGPGGALAVEEAQPGTRFMLMAGKPYGETPIYNREPA